MIRQSTTSTTIGRVFFLCQQGGNSLGQSRLAMAEVQICGIPKQDTQEVASTP